MKRYRIISIFLMSLSGLIGLIRGYRMTFYPGGNSILFPYPQDLINDTVFSNQTLFGWIVFFLIGIFSMVVIITILLHIRNYAYFIIVEGVFISFFTLTHIVYTGFSFIHFFILPLCLLTFIIGFLQTPRDF